MKQAAPRQILRAFRGLHDECCETDFNAELSLQEWIETLDGQDEFWGMRFCSILEDFGISEKSESWKGILQILNRPSSETETPLSVMDFAAILAEHSRIPDFGVRDICGVQSEEAGLFLGMQDTLKVLQDRKRLRFGPRTRILDCVRGSDLELFWGRLTHQIGLPLPPLNWPYQKLSGGLMLKAFVCLLLAVLWLVMELPLTFVRELILAFLLFGIGFRIMHRGNPLPEGIETFADLCDWICVARKVSARYE